MDNHDPLRDIMREMSPIDDIIEACAARLWSELSHNLHAPKGVKVWLDWYELPDSDFKSAFRDIAHSIVGRVCVGLETTGLGVSEAVALLSTEDEAA